jgi:hypothetical protein
MGLVIDNSLFFKCIGNRFGNIFIMAHNKKLDYKEHFIKDYWINKRPYSFPFNNNVFHYFFLY